MRGATRGLQDEQYVIRVVLTVCHVLTQMTEGNEQGHLAWLCRQVCLRGTDVRIAMPGDQIQREWCIHTPLFAGFGEQF